MTLAPDDHRLPAADSPSEPPPPPPAPCGAFTTIGVPGQIGGATLVKCSLLAGHEAAHTGLVSWGP